ncbi:MAG: hypothetical protein IT355_20525 [Gemmatimonadaceae bacterium]|nr:hypothetical protein [Gemmatimonadaceae bacterium]
MHTSRRPTPMRALLVAAALCTMALPARSDGQLLELQPGTKVRVTAPPLLGGRYDAVVGTRTADTLWLVRSGSPTIAVPLTALTSVEVSRGRSRSRGAVRGILWGGGIGLALGVLAAVSDDQYGSGSCGSGAYYGGCQSVSRAEIVSGVTFGGVLWGAGIGALVGRERWETLQTAPRVGLRLDQAAGRTRLGLRIGF